MIRVERPGGAYHDYKVTTEQGVGGVTSGARARDPSTRVRVGDVDRGVFGRAITRGRIPRLSIRYGRTGESRGRARGVGNARDGALRTSMKICDIQDARGLIGIAFAPCCEFDVTSGRVGHRSGIASAASR